MTEKHAVRLIIEGIVQGVWYRGSAQRQAGALKLAGWVRNLPDGRVELYAEGPKDDLEQLIGWSRQGPSGAQVTNVEVEWREAEGKVRGFDIAY